MTGWRHGAIHDWTHATVWTGVGTHHRTTWRTLGGALWTTLRRAWLRWVGSKAGSRGDTLLRSIKSDAESLDRLAMQEIEAACHLPSHRHIHEPFLLTDRHEAQVHHSSKV